MPVGASALEESGERDTGQAIFGGRFRARRNSELPALEENDGAITGFKGIGDALRGLFKAAGIAAGKDIDCRVAVFGPCVNTDMRFGDYDNAGHALGAELMKRAAYDRRADAFGCVDERRFNRSQIIQDIGIALTKFHQHMRP